MEGFDHLYAVDVEKLEAVRSQKPWMADPKYCKKVMISPSATIKMMMHGQSGVERGIKQNGKPIEIMGLLLGRPNPDDPHAIIISDAQPLPIEGMETRVVADDEDVQNYMISLVEMNEQSGTRDIFCGWYHTHPFEVDVHSQCFLSGTDVSTQLQWQRAEDHHGNPWVSIVIDPLRSVHKGRPELQAYRVYPPDYSSAENEVSCVGVNGATGLLVTCFVFVFLFVQTPDGKIVLDDKLRVERWGACWNRYYTLDTHYYMSNLAKQTLSVLKNNFLWMNALTTTPSLEPGRPTAQHTDRHWLQVYARDMLCLCLRLFVCRGAAKYC